MKVTRSPEGPGLKERVSWESVREWGGDSDVFTLESIPIFAAFNRSSNRRQDYRSHGNLQSIKTGRSQKHFPNAVNREEARRRKSAPVKIFGLQVARRYLLPPGQLSQIPAILAINAVHQCFLLRRGLRQFILLSCDNNSPLKQTTHYQKFPRTLSLSPCSTCRLMSRPSLPRYK